MTDDNPCDGFSLLKASAFKDMKGKEEKKRIWEWFVNWIRDLELMFDESKSY